MRFIDKLEKDKTIWYLLGFYVVFFLLRLPSLIEPNWYGDEGIYQVLGKAIASGRILYAEIFDNKPPFLYLTYALFNGEQFPVRFLSLISGSAAVISFFYLTRLIFKTLKPVLYSTALFTFLFAVPTLEGNIANAENFMLFPIILAGLFIFSTTDKIKYGLFKSINMQLFASGVLLGSAFLFKIVAVFDFAAFIVFLVITAFPKRFILSVEKVKSTAKELLRQVLPFALGFLIPLLLTGVYFFAQNAFSEFIKATFFSNVGYVGYGNKFIIPQGLLILKLVFLLGFIVFLFFKRKVFTKSELFIFLWFAFSLFNAYFSHRPYMHYTLVLLPAFCLLFGLVFEKINPRLRSFSFIILILSIIILNSTFKFSLTRTFKYYQNTITYISGQKTTHDYRNFFDRKTPRDYEIASFIKSRTKQSDNIFVWGDSAQIYALSEKLPPGKYTVSYHIRQYKNGIQETEEAVKKANPKFVVILKESKSFPYSLPNYQSRIVFDESVIYERIY